MKLNRIYIETAAALFSISILVGCTDDKIELNGTGQGTDDVINSRSGYLEFNISSGSNFGGLEGHDQTGLLGYVTQDKAEKRINPENFQVVLLDINGSIKAIWPNQDMTEVSESDGRISYSVRIPQQDMSEEVIEYMKKYPFKIAVMANWEDYPEFVTEKDKKFYESKNPTNKIDQNNIFYMTHCIEDPSYESDKNDEEQHSDATVFQFLTGDGYKMGISQEWVIDRYENDNEAEEDIRREYNIKENKFITNKEVGYPQTKHDKPIPMQKYTYNNMWKLWNFGGTKNWDSNNSELHYSGDEVLILNSEDVKNENVDFLTPKSGYFFYNSPNEEVRRAWSEKNEVLYKTAFPEEVTVENLSSFKINGLEFNSASGLAKSVIRNNLYGITLNRYANNINDNALPNETVDPNKDYFHFKIEADGYIMVKCESGSSSADVRIVARRGPLDSNNDKDVFTESILIGKSEGNRDIKTVRFAYNDLKKIAYTASNEPLDICIYGANGNLTIYEIEYIKSRMLQVSDRQTLKPTEVPEGGISMYGIQDFDAIGDYWASGTTFNLSKWMETHIGDLDNEYHYRRISMLRSVAKVEIFIPTHLVPKPSHMYLRSMNRHSRSNPKDVFTPTNILWDGWTDSQGYEKEVVDFNSEYTHKYNEVDGVDKELERLKQYGFTYDETEDEINFYQNLLAWQFGIWNSEFGWNWGSVSPSAENDQYPRIFNTRISRTDYAHMIDGGIVDGCYYYYAYIPEKNITDPNDKGTATDIPKVLHIEMRFGDRNTDDNLDDNGCYRIYFATNGNGGTAVTDRNGYQNALENSTDALKKNYPVMRNHLYRFNVKSISMNSFEVDYTIAGEATRDVLYEFE